MSKKASQVVVDDRVAASMNQAAAWLGMAKPVLIWAKNAGCPAFVGPRVRLSEFRTWWEENRGKLHDVDLLPDKDVLDRFLRQQRLELGQIEKDELAGKLINRDEVTATIQAVSQRVVQVLRSKCEHELPAQLKGLDEIAIREQLMKLVDSVLEEWRAPTSQWNQTSNS
jgi:hypothetical protein